ncbi:MAG TPA: hypothetical protein VM934_00210 [Pyrinomonadaceae bacterium]|jgi:hypothetical protein|nr:hypothetical protein [Pyrinomonadaceae bacterium]
MSNGVVDANILRDRFIAEQDYVLKYIEILRYKLSLDVREVNRLIYSLEKYGICKKNESLLQRALFSKKSYDDINELQKLLSDLQDVRPEIETALTDVESKFAHLKKPEDLNSVDVRSLAGECIDFLVEAFENSPSPDDIRRAREELKKQLESSEEEPVWIATRKGSIDELVDYSVESALYLKQARRLNDLRWALDSIEDVDITVRMFRSDTEINILRQGFITLTTILDATVFDLMKVALRKDFFNQIVLFADKQDKLSINKFDQFSNFDNLRDSVIEERLKSKYLREILYILNENGIQLADPLQGDEFIHLQEMMMRRNIHVHNRGIVDSKYLEVNENGRPRYNIYGLTEDTIAHIDSMYWERANRLSVNCVRFIADWINALP